MTPKDILTPVINLELQKYVNQGYKIKLKSVTSKRITYTLVCGLLSVVGLFLIAIPVYIVLMVKSNNKIDMILAQAKKEPNKPIEQIIAEDIKI